MNKDVHRSTVLSGQNREATQYPPTVGGVNSFIFIQQSNELTRAAQIRMNPVNNVERKKPGTKCTLYDSIYMKVKTDIIIYNLRLGGGHLWGGVGQLVSAWDGALPGPGQGSILLSRQWLHEGVHFVKSHHPITLL